MSDERLVEQVRKGEPVAFEVLYDRHSAGILAFCRHMLGSSADAEDAVQHTFMAASADIARSGRRDLHVKAWLYTIARNRCLSVLRARREQPVDDHVEVATDNLLHDVEQREDIRALLADVAKLPDDQRAALVLSEVGDLSHADISEVLGCEAAKVKSLVFQARSALIDRREARNTPCAEIREQLATLRGGALRRSQIRHHLEACPGCTEYREEIKRQRAMLALALPVVPSAVLRAKVLGSAGIGGSAAATAAGTGAGVTAGASAGGASGLAGLAAQGGLAKLGVAVALAAAGAGGAAVAHNGGLPSLHTGSQPAAATQARSSTAHTGASFIGMGSDPAGNAGTTAASHRSASGTAHGFTPVTGESNGARAREFAATRGKGKHKGTTNKHHNLAAQGHVKGKPDHVKHVATPQANPKRTQPAPKTRTQPTHTGPANSAPTHTQPTPTPKVKTTPTPTATTPAPTPTTEINPPTTTPDASSGGGNSGKSLGTTKKNASATTG
jgi:RNA polymerase sigma factor (sigma-70 family)